MNDIKEKFYKTFGIEPFTCCDEGCKTIGFAKNCEVCFYNKRQFPKITYRILLELICILTKYRMKEYEFYKIKTSSTKILKNYILEDCIDMIRYLNELDKKEYKQQVQSLFEGVHRGV